jgi:hypothetical protein
VVLCPDVAPNIDSRFGCCNLLQRSVIHDGAERKASSAIISTPHSGRNDRNGMLRVYLAALPKIEAPALFPFRFRPGLLYWSPQLPASSVPSTNPPEEKNERGRNPAE